MTNRKEKYRRMALRYDIGNREPSPEAPSEPHGHPAYLVAHACFDCRKSFKMSPEHDHVCPQCGNPVHWMGRAFKAPRQSDEEQWQKVQLLYAYGFRFHRYGGDYEAPPERLREVEEFIERNPNHALRIAPYNPSLLPTKG